MQVTRSHLAIAIASFAVLLIAGASSIDAQSTTSATNSKASPPGVTKKWVAPRTAWGEPDLEGLWPAIDMQGTPYERPQDVQGEAVSDTQFAERQRASQQQTQLDAEQYVVNRPRRNAGTGPPSHWGEHGVPSRQASLVVDPVDGRIPPMTEEGKKRIALARSTYWYDFPDQVVAHPFETFEDLGPYDRCITRGVLASMLPTGYNMGTRILQYPGHVVIQNEMIHEVRDIPVNGRGHIAGNIRSYMGDSIGRWDGDTLVVETTNFNAKVGLTRNGNTLLHSQDLKLTERLTRVDEKTIEYEATVDDTRTWTRPWKVSLPLTRHPEYQMYEYACHEGNYAVRNILSGERALEKAAGASTK